MTYACAVHQNGQTIEPIYELFHCVLVTYVKFKKLDTNVVEGSALFFEFCF